MGILAHFFLRDFYIHSNRKEIRRGEEVNESNGKVEFNFSF